MSTLFNVFEVRATRQDDGKYEQEDITRLFDDPAEFATYWAERLCKLAAKGWPLETTKHGVMGKMGKYSICIELRVDTLSDPLPSPKLMDEFGFPTTDEEAAKDAADPIKVGPYVPTPEAERLCKTCGGTVQYGNLGKCYPCNGTGFEPKRKDYQLDQKPLTGNTEVKPVDDKNRKLKPGIYTVVLDSMGDSYRTLKVSIPKQGGLVGKTIVSYLSGPDNENDYTGFAFYDEELGRISLWKKFKNDSALTVALDTLLCDPSGAGERYAMQSGNCYRCGRTLTVPASLHRGMGPECAKK